MPDIFTYLDFRKYLADSWAERKAEDPRFSHRYIAMKAGFTSPAFFSRILAGEVHLQPSGVLKLAEIFRLGNRETRFFELLVLYGQSKSHEEKTLFLDRIVAWRKSNVARLESEQTAFCKDWRAVAILQALDLLDPGAPAAELGSMLHPPVDSSEVERILALLERIGLARKEEDGIWRKTEAVLSTGDADSEALDLFHQATMALGMESIDRFDRSDRSISTLTLSVSKATFDRLRDRIRLLRREALDLARGDEHPDRVLQINFQMFPLALLRQEKEET